MKIIMQTRPCINTFLSIIGICFSLLAPGQTLTVQNGANVFVQANAVLFVDSLVLSPSSGWNLTGPNSISRSTTVIHSTANPYIRRVYQFSNNTASFNGVITFYYRDS